MTSIEAKRLAQRIARIEREQANQGKPQLAYSSIENGNLKSYEGNDLKMVVGLQDDGGQATTVFNGPTPPTPANYTVTVDHGSLTVHWDGDFENDVVAPSDWARWTAYAQEGGTVTPSRSTAIGGTDSASGGEVTAGVLKGQWTVAVLAWSQAGKPSAMGDPVTVDVPGYGDIVLAEIDAAETAIKNGSDILVTAQDTLGGKLDSAFGSIDSINDDMSDLDAAVRGAITSANGKNTVHFDDHAPGPEVEGVEGDAWFVGRVGRPEDIIEATNVAENPSLETGATNWAPYGWAGTGARTQGQGAFGEWFYRLAASGSNTGNSGRYRDHPAGVTKGETWTISIHVRPSVTVTMRARAEMRSGGSIVSGSLTYGTFTSCPAGVWTRLHVSITAPENADTIRHQTYLADASLPSGGTLDLDAEMISRGELSPYFDGDTESGETDNESHYRWTGTPHESTSEKYLPATDGLSDKWNVTEQYRHDGTGWVQVELSHSVISSVDVGALTAGSAAIKEAVVQKLFAEVVVSRMSVADEFIGENAILTGAVTAPKITASEELWAKIGEFVKIRAEQLEADAIDGMVITGPNIRTAASGARVQLDAGGLSVYDSLDDWQVRLTPDGSSFKGDLEAESLVANGAAEFKSTDNMLAQGAKLTLASGVTDPTAPPIVQPYWDSLDFESPHNVPLVGLAFDGTNYWSASPAHQWPYDGGIAQAIRVDATTGEVQSFRPPATNRTEYFGVTCIGSELFWLYRSGYKAFVLVTDLNCVELREWEYPAIGYGPGNPLTYKPGIGNDGTNVVIAQCLDSGSLVWRTYNKTTGAAISYVDANDATKSDISGIYIGAADHGGGASATIAKTATKTLPSYTTSGVYDPERSWRMADDASDTGIVFADGKFRTLNPSGTIREYANAATGDGSGDWWCAYRWETDTDSDGTIDYRSKISPPSRFTWPRRARLKATGQPKPVGVELMAGYLAKKTTKPARTDFKRNYTGYSTTRSIAYWDWYQNTGDAPADGNTYPTVTPSSVASASGTFQVNGDGSGKWGPLTFNTDGTMSSSAVPAWIPITSFLNGWAVGSFGFAPAYRVWPDGKVEWRGVVKGSAASTDTPIINIPTNARPAQYVPMGGACNGGGGNPGWTRIDVNDPDAVNMIRLNPQIGSVTWASLDLIEYYKN